MGRPPLTEATVSEIKKSMIKSAREQLYKNGIKSVTIRGIAKDVQVNSAIIYKYFNDLDELLLYSCLDLFKSYCKDLSEVERHYEGNREKIFIETWKLFGKYALKYPESFNHLFFSKHSKNMDEIFKKYYELYPEQLEGLTPQITSMLKTADLKRRNLRILEPIIEKSADRSTIDAVNDIMVAYFHQMLNDKISGKIIDEDESIIYLLKVCRFLVLSSKTIEF